jgi:hypothetical protein
MESKILTITIEKKFHVVLSEEDINDLLTTAFEGGINSWCGEVIINEVEKFPRMFASDVISHEGTLTLCDSETDDKWELTLDKFLKGVKWYCETYNIISTEDLMDNHDATTADLIVQYALFDEIVFG